MKSTFQICHGHVIDSNENGLQGFQLWKKGKTNYFIPLNKEGRPQYTPPRGCSFVQELRPR